MPDLIVVSGGASSDFPSAMALLASLYQHERETATVVLYDMGFSKPERTMLCAAFPHVHLRNLEGMRHGHGPLAANRLWKSVVLREVAEQFHVTGLLLWLDVDARVLAKLDGVRASIVQRGVLAAASGDGSCVTGAAARVVGAVAEKDERLAEMRVVDGRMLGFDMSRDCAKQAVFEWARCAAETLRDANSGTPSAGSEELLTVVWHLLRSHPLLNDKPDTPLEKLRVEHLRVSL